MRLAPSTDATITFRLTDEDGAVVNSATVTANIYSPKAREIALNQAMPSTGSGGLYELTWDKTWTTYQSKIVLGEYLVVVQGINAGVTRTDRFRIPVLWGDTE